MIYKFCYQREKKRIKKYLFLIEITIYQKEYDIRLVASLTLTHCNRQAHKRVLLQTVKTPINTA